MPNRVQITNVFIIKHILLPVNLPILVIPSETIQTRLYGYLLKQQQQEFANNSQINS